MQRLFDCQFLEVFEVRPTNPRVVDVMQSNDGPAAHVFEVRCHLLGIPAEFIMFHPSTCIMQYTIAFVLTFCLNFLYLVWF